MNFLNNTFFFFIDVHKDFELIFLKTNFFFKKSDLLSNTKYFFPLNLQKKKDNIFFEKNEKFLSFFFFLDKIFFKNQIKTLFFFLKNENKILINEKKQFILIFLWYYYYKYIFSFLFLLKIIAKIIKNG